MNASCRAVLRGLLLVFWITNCAAIGFAQYGGSAQAPPPRGNTAGPANGVVGAVQPMPAQQLPAPKPPVQLTPQEQEALHRMLVDWEKKSDGIKAFRCSFVRREYNVFGKSANEPTTTSTGEIKYNKPDKGLFRVTGAETWICDGKTLYQLDPQKKLLTEHPLPPQMQGPAVANGPLPFLFGAKADELERRYFLKIVTPADAKEQIWIDAGPRTREDAANFSHVSLILTAKTFVPVAMQVYDPNDGNGRNRTSYVFEYTKINDAFGFLEPDFSKPSLPSGWKRFIAPNADGSPAAPPNGMAPSGPPAAQRIPPPTIR